MRAEELDFILKAMGSQGRLYLNLCFVATALTMVWRIGWVEWRIREAVQCGGGEGWVLTHVGIQGVVPWGTCWAKGEQHGLSSVWKCQETAFPILSN